MAKSVAASFRAAWEAAKKDFQEGQSTETLKKDVIDVMDLAKNKATQVKNRATSSSSSQSKSVVASGKIGPRVNQDAGAELLTHFKEEWGEIHQSTASNSLVAAKIDADLKLLSQSVTRSHTILSRCQEEFSHLKEVVEALDEAQSKVESIGQLVLQVEEDLRQYSLAKVELSAERRKHSMQRQHEKEIADNHSKVEHLRKVLVNEEQMSLKMKHELENKELRERQMAFQDMFDKQMADYRTRGKVDRPVGEESRERSRSQLEEVVIEDEDGTASLHEFLSDVVMEESNGGIPGHGKMEDEGEEEEGGEGNAPNAKLEANEMPS